MLIEIARFWASIATYNAELDRYEILGVMGPDEYHDAYPDSGRAGAATTTPTPTSWRSGCCSGRCEALEVLPPHYRQELVDELTIRDEELDRWRDITRKMRVVFHADGVLDPVRGLRAACWSSTGRATGRRYGNIQRLDRLLEAEGDSANRYKVSKQADVLMLLFLLSRGRAARAAARPRLRDERPTSSPAPSPTTSSAPRTARR